MKVCHVCLSNYFAEGFLYQENQLVRKHADAGHEVLVIASTQSFASDGSVTHVSPGKSRLSEGVTLVRLPYRKLGLSAITRKVRAHRGVEELLREYAPDVVMFHGLAGWELRSVVRYAQRSPGCKLVVDSHTDHNNSGRNWLSLNLLHKGFYRAVIHSVIDEIGCVLCVSKEVEAFAHDVYGIPKEKLEFFPLGGDVLPNSEYAALRNAGRQKLGVHPKEIVIVQSGRFAPPKKLIESLRAFSQVDRDDLRLFLSGVLSEEVRAEAEALIRNDARVTFLGWNSPDSLTELLCAADLYLQPGSQSATMQHSLCCRCPVILADVPSHYPYIADNGWLVSDFSEVQSILKMLSRVELERMSGQSYRLAGEILDYRVLAQRVMA